VSGVTLHLTDREFALDFALGANACAWRSNQLIQLGKLLIQLAEQRRWADGGSAEWRAGR